MDYVPERDAAEAALGLDLEGILEGKGLILGVLRSLTLFHYYIYKN